MGLPIEWRISEEARRSRQPKNPSRTVPQGPTSNPYRHHPFPSYPRVSGLNHDAITDMRAYFNHDRTPANHRSQQQKGRLILLRTFLSTAVRAHRSSSMNFENGLAQFLPSDTESEDAHVHVRRRFRSRRTRNAMPRAVSEVLLYDSDGGEGMRRVNSPLSRNTNIPLTYSAVSMLYEQHRDPQTAKVWEIGCWAGTHQLAASDMLHLFFDVLTEVSAIPSCQVDELCIADSLDECTAVIEAVNLLKDLSAELHASYDKNSDYFIHPMTERPVHIVLSR